MPYTLSDIQKEIIELKQTMDNLPWLVFDRDKNDKVHENDLKIAALMYAPDHSLLYLSGLISKTDAHICQMEYRDIQKKNELELSDIKGLPRPYFLHIESLKPAFCEVFAQLQDGDLNLAPPVKNKFMTHIKNLRRAGALYELTFLNSHALKYDLSDILPTPFCVRQRVGQNTAHGVGQNMVQGVGQTLKKGAPLLAGNKMAPSLEEQFAVLWDTAMALNSLPAADKKYETARRLLGVMVCHHFYDAVDALVQKNEDMFNPGVAVRTRKMAAYFKELTPKMGRLNNEQVQEVFKALIKTTRAQVKSSTDEADWQAYLTNWYDMCTAPVVKGFKKDAAMKAISVKRVGQESAQKTVKEETNTAGNAIKAADKGHMGAASDMSPKTDKGISKGLGAEGISNGGTVSDTPQKTDKGISKGLGAEGIAKGGTVSDAPQKTGRDRARGANPEKVLEQLKLTAAFKKRLRGRG